MHISNRDRELNIIRPGLLNDKKSIRAWFTLKNSDTYSSAGSTINGLDLGSNTLSTRNEITANRSYLFEEIGLQAGWVAFADQVHGNRVRFVSAGGNFPGTDALVTDVPGLALAVQVADCAVVLLADPDSGIIAAVHAGWRGAAGGILPSTIETMKIKGSRPYDMRAFISPCISKENFEVGEEVAVRFPDPFVDRESFRKPHVDLQQFLCSQLLEAGLSNKFIEVDGSCTVRESDRFYSYRREKKRSGRMLGIIQIGLNGAQ